MKRKINLIFNKDCDRNLLRNKNIGIIGFGNVGSRFSEIAIALGMKVSVFSKSLSLYFLIISPLLKWLSVNIFFELLIILEIRNL